MQSRVKLINTSQSWNSKKRYKVNETVVHLGIVYQNTTGRNSDPTLLTDWFVVKPNETVSTRIVPFRQIFLGGLQEFTLPTFAQIIQVSINGWSTENYTTPDDTTVIIIDPIATGQQVVILYLVDENTNIAPYYTQAQVDALIAVISSGSVTEGEYTNTNLNLTGTFNISNVTFLKCYWTQYTNKKTLNLSLNFTPTAVGNCNITLNLPELINEAGTAELLGTGSIFSSLNSGSATVQKDSLTTGRIFFKALDVNIYTLYTIITYKIQ